MSRAAEIRALAKAHPLRRKVGLFVEPVLPDRGSPEELEFLRAAAAAGFSPSAAVRERLDSAKQFALMVLRHHGLSVEDPTPVSKAAPPRRLKPAAKYAMQLLQSIDGRAPEELASDEWAAAFAIGVHFGTLQNRLFAQLHLEKDVKRGQKSTASLKRASKAHRKITPAAYRAAKRKARNRTELASLLGVTPQGLRQAEHAHPRLSRSK